MRRTELLLMEALIILAIAHLFLLFPKNDKSADNVIYDIGYFVTAPKVGKVRVVPLAGNKLRNIIEKQ